LIGQRKRYFGVSLNYLSQSKTLKFHKQQTTNKMALLSKYQFIQNYLNPPKDSVLLKLEEIMTEEMLKGAKDGKITFKIPYVITSDQAIYLGLKCDKLGYDNTFSEDKSCSKISPDVPCGWFKWGLGPNDFK
jgi:hypothetical protein